MQKDKLEKIKNLLNGYKKSQSNRSRLILNIQNVDNINLNEFRNFRIDNKLFLCKYCNIQFKNKNYIPGSYLVKYNNQFKYYFPIQPTFTIGKIIDIIKDYKLTENTIKFLVKMSLHTGLIKTLPIISNFENELKIIFQKKYFII